MMRRGSLHAGNSGMTPPIREQDWKTRTMSNLRAADELWAYNIRAHDEFRLHEADQFGPVNDAVLLRLFQLGLYDWKGLDDRSADETEAMRLSSTMAMRMMQRILLLEKQASDPDLLVCLEDRWLLSGSWQGQVDGRFVKKQH